MSQTHTFAYEAGYRVAQDQEYFDGRPEVEVEAVVAELGGTDSLGEGQLLDIISGAVDYARLAAKGSN